MNFIWKYDALKDQAPGNGYKILGAIFFGNYFYGCCAVALAVEASLQQQYPLNGGVFYFLIFISTVLYYCYPYIRNCSFGSSDPRANWYAANYTMMQRSQVMITVILFLSLMVFLWLYGDTLLHMPPGQWLPVLIFPTAAALYYGCNLLSVKYNLRRTGWLKSFVIGFVWAGLVTYYPVVFYAITHKEDYKHTLTGFLLFLKNFMFITVLSIMFDIKDYAADHFSRLRTLVVKLGLRKTIFYILLPLTVAGLGAFVFYAVAHHFHPIKIILNVVPFILLLIVIWSLRRRRPVLYYLVVIDGLMLVKAICGTIAMSYF